MIVEAAKPLAVLLPRSPTELAFRSDAELAKCPMITGHTGFGLIRRLRPPVQTILFLREPVARVVSQYRYFVELASDPATPGNPFAAMLRGRTLEQLLREAHEPFVEQYFCNLQTFCVHSNQFMYYRKDVRHLPPEQILEQAFANLDRVDVLGIVEQMDESIRRMQAYFGWENVTMRHDMRSRKQTQLALSDELIDLIRQHNQLDLALYEEACRRFAAGGPKRAEG